MSWYEFLLFVHIASIVVWVGGAAFAQAVGLRVGADPANRLVAYARDLQWIGTRLFVPAALVALVSGILLVVEGPWSFGDDWISIGLVLFAIAFAVGLFFFTPESGRIADLFEREGLGPAVGARVGRIVLLTRLELILLFLLIFDMTVKPELDEWGTVLLALFAVAVAAALVVWRAVVGARRAAAAAAAGPPA